MATRALTSLALAVLSTAPARGTDGDTPDLAPIMEALTEIRGLAFEHEVPAADQSPEDFARFVADEIDRTYLAERRPGIESGLFRLGMFTTPVDLRAELLAALASQAAAYYDPAEGTFYYLATDIPSALLEATAAHELVHALQDQHFDLSQTAEQLESATAADVRDDDRVLAHRGLVEGEATYVHTLWTMRSLMGVDLTQNEVSERRQFRMMAETDPEVYAGDSGDAASRLAEEEQLDALGEAREAMARIPAYILAPFHAAYMRGAFFTMSLRHAGGWAAVDAAHARPPTSSEQVVHPEKYVDPERVDTRSTFALPAPPPVLADWTRIDAAIHGELLLRVLLGNHGASAEAARVATEGWDGDLYTAWRSADDRVLVTLATTWDTREDAAEFADAYARLVERRWRVAPATDAVREEPHAGGEETRRDVVRAWDCGDGFGAGGMLERGVDVLVVEGGTRAEVDAMLDALAAAPVDRVD